MITNKLNESPLTTTTADNSNRTNITNRTL